MAICDSGSMVEIPSYLYNNTTLYRVDSDADMGFSDIYTSIAKAENAIRETDWSDLGMTLEEVVDAGLVCIYDVSID